jgi:hypothetical protein
MCIWCIRKATEELRAETFRPSGRLEHGLAFDRMDWRLGGWAGLTGDEVD